jgi:hypothetical protein
LPINLKGSLSGRSIRDVTVVDLSVTGCLVQCGARFDPGAILDVEIALDGDKIGGKVRVRDAFLDGASPAGLAPRYLVGLEFLGLPAQQATRLRLFLLERQRRGSAGD